MSKLSHIDDSGHARMVDVSDKEVTIRRAVATGRVKLSRDAFDALKAGTLKKGDAIGTARIAGIMAAKNTSNLIPLCHPLPLSHIDLNISLNESDCTVRIESTVGVSSRTGVEMEALTAVSVAALTIYDMCKAIDKSAEIGEIRLREKSGGASGEYHADLSES